MSTEFDSDVFNNDTLKVRGDKPWFIKFFKPTCPHCKKMAKAWRELYSTHSEEINIASMDCTNLYAKEVCK